MTKELLRISGVSAGYGQFPVLHEVSFQVLAGEICCVVGANGAGKTTLMRAISGLLNPWSGSIQLGGREISGLSAEKVVSLGLAHVPQERHIFLGMTVRENLMMGATALRHKAGARKRTAHAVEHWMDRFPILRERAERPAGVLSGGEQQMLAICRALMSEPTLLLMDEPSLGLSPAATEFCFELIIELRAQGLTILLVEQNDAMVNKVGDSLLTLEFGQVTTRLESASSIQKRQIQI